jgi:deoxycytidylate deaminase
LGTHSLLSLQANNSVSFACGLALQKTSLNVNNQNAERERIEAETRKLHAEAQAIANQAAKEALTDFPFLTCLPICPS